MENKEEQTGAVPAKNVNVVVSRECIDCDHCGKANPPTRCSKCHTVYYCDRTCQKNDWQDHKPWCIPVDEMRRKVAGVGGGGGDAKKKATKIPDDGNGQPCPICLSETLEDPVSLPDCGHTFCFPCLQELQKHAGIPSLNSAATPGKSRCPYCRTQISDDVETVVLDRAHLYAARAARLLLTDSEEAAAAYEQALRELEPLEDDNIQALFSRAEILLGVGRPEEALLALERLLEKERENTDRTEQINEMIEKGERLGREGRVDESEAIMEEIEKLAKEGFQRLQGDGVAKYFGIYLQMAKAYLAQGKWEEACAIYGDKMLRHMTSGPLGTPSEQRAVWSGLCRCSYELGEYDKSISAGSAALEMNRHYPGSHEYVARSQMAIGSLEEAKKTMGRGVIYETPWDEHHQEEMKKLYACMFES